MKQTPQQMAEGKGAKRHTAINGPQSLADTIPKITLSDNNSVLLSINGNVVLEAPDKALLKRKPTDAERLLYLRYHTHQKVDLPVNKRYDSSFDYATYASIMLLDWNNKLLSMLVEDIKSGELLKQYRIRAAQLAAVEPHEGAALPPGHEFYAKRTVRDELGRKETAPEFIKRVYGEAGWLTGSFTRADLRRIDPAAEMGLRNWEKTHKQRAVLILPTVKELNDQEVAQPEAAKRAKDGARVNSALRRRGL